MAGYTARGEQRQRRPIPHTIIATKEGGPLMRTLAHAHTPLPHTHTPYLPTITASCLHTGPWFTLLQSQPKELQVCLLPPTSLPQWLPWSLSCHCPVTNLRNMYFPQKRAQLNQSDRPSSQKQNTRRKKMLKSSGRGQHINTFQGIA